MGKDVVVIGMKSSDLKKVNWKSVLKKPTGWQNESARHSMARYGIKTGRKSRLSIVPTYVPRGSGNNANAGKRDLHYKIKEWGYVFPTKKDAEKYAEEHEEKNGVIREIKEKEKGLVWYDDYLNGHHIQIFRKAKFKSGDKFGHFTVYIQGKKDKSFTSLSDAELFAKDKIRKSNLIITYPSER